MDDVPVKSVNLFLQNKTKTHKSSENNLQEIMSLRQKRRTSSRFSFKTSEYFLYGGQTEPQNKCFYISLGNLVTPVFGLNISVLVAQHVWTLRHASWLDCQTHLYVVATDVMSCSVPHQKCPVGSLLKCCDWCNSTSASSTSTVWGP